MRRKLRIYPFKFPSLNTECWQPWHILIKYFICCSMLAQSTWNQFNFHHDYQHLLVLRGRLWSFPDILSTSIDSWQFDEQPLTLTTAPAPNILYISRFCCCQLGIVFSFPQSLFSKNYTRNFSNFFRSLTIYQYPNYFRKNIFHVLNCSWYFDTILLSKIQLRYISHFLKLMQ